MYFELPANQDDATSPHLHLHTCLKTWERERKCKGGGGQWMRGRGESVWACGVCLMFQALMYMYKKRNYTWQRFWETHWIIIEKSKTNPCCN